MVVTEMWIVNVALQASKQINKHDIYRVSQKNVYTGYPPDTKIYNAPAKIVLRCQVLLLEDGAPLLSSRCENLSA